MDTIVTGIFESSLGIKKEKITKYYNKFSIFLYYQE